MKCALNYCEIAKIKNKENSQELSKHTERKITAKHENAITIAIAITISDERKKKQTTIIIAIHNLLAPTEATIGQLIKCLIASAINHLTNT